MKHITYTETQHIYHGVGIIGVAVLFFLLALVIVTIIYRRYMMAGFLGIICLLIAFVMFASKLETEIKPDGFYYSYPVFMWKQEHIEWTEVDKVYVRKYAPQEFGGWGMKSNDSNMSYTAYGDSGVQFILKDKQQLLFGTQHAEEVQKILDSIGFRHQ